MPYVHSIVQRCLPTVVTGREVSAPLVEEPDYRKVPALRRKVQWRLLGIVDHPLRSMGDGRDVSTHVDEEPDYGLVTCLRHKVQWRLLSV
jgi:hypothetical protein